MASLDDGNNLLCDITDIHIWDLGNAIFGKMPKESLVGSNNNIVLLMVNMTSSAILVYVNHTVLGGAGPQTSHLRTSHQIF